MKFPNFVSAGVVVIAAALVSAVPASAKTEDLRKKYALPTHVQLKPFPAPTTSRSGRTAPITVFLEAFEKNQTGTICRYQPKIMDVIITRLHQNPIPVNGRGINLTGIAERLVMPINQALGQNMVKSVYIVAGAREMTKGGISRLPFNAGGCRGIKNLQK